jgi:hypothetical protein|tara:strand:- start:1082 stop:1276 length:195 start_codon:yes stop_codon:yes gene_type:complete
MLFLTYIVLISIIGIIWGFTITWLLYDEDKPLGVIILNSTEDEVCTYVEKIEKKNFQKNLRKKK